MLDKVYEIFLDNKDDFELVDLKKDSGLYKSNKTGLLVDIRFSNGKPIYIKFSNL